MSDLDKLTEFNEAFEIYYPKEQKVEGVKNNSALQKLAEAMEELAQDLNRFAASSQSPEILRLQLIQEEVSELAYAIHAKDKQEVLDALTDLTYVVTGSYLTFGMGSVKQQAFDEVHRSNMSKLDKDGKPIRELSGRVMKSDNYTAPDLKQFVEE